MSAVGSSAMSGASLWLAAQPTGALLSTIRAASAAAAMRDRVGNRRGLIVCVPFALSPGRWLGLAPLESSLSDWYARRGRGGFVGPRRLHGRGTAPRGFDGDGARVARIVPGRGRLVAVVPHP